MTKSSAAFHDLSVGKYAKCLQRDLWTEAGLKRVYRRVDAVEAKKHWEFWYEWTEKNCLHGYTCSKCALPSSALADEPVQEALHLSKPRLIVIYVGYASSSFGD